MFWCPPFFHPSDDGEWKERLQQLLRLPLLRPVGVAVCVVQAGDGGHGAGDVKSEENADRDED